MEQKSSPLMKSSVTNGVYLGLIGILISVVIWAGGLIESMGIFGGAIIGLVSFVISCILIFIFTKTYRNKELGGFISFGEAFKFAMLVVIVSTLISVFYNYIFHSFIAPDYMQNLMAVMQQKTMTFMESKGVPEAQMDAALEKFQEIPTIWKTLRQTAVTGIISGAIISLIVAAIVKKKEEDVIE
uniref:DUF4199 domain-containing protein n=1 Tax=uncultured Draconibacterium sp. TaxID=1573823 RepID=UPI0032177F1B